jgi:hypothetical protein
MNSKIEFSLSLGKFALADFERMLALSCAVRQGGRQRIHIQRRIRR